MFYFLIYVIDNFSCSGLANRATLFSVYKFQDNMDTIFSMEDILRRNGELTRMQRLLLMSWKTA